MKIRLASVLITLGGEILLIPFLINPFMATPKWLEWSAYSIGTACFAGYYFFRRHDGVLRAKETAVVREAAAFYRHYPWRPLATGLLVCFGIMVVALDEWLDLTSSQAFAIGLAIWGLPNLAGEVLFGGRREGPKLTQE